LRDCKSFSSAHGFQDLRILKVAAWNGKYMSNRDSTLPKEAQTPWCGILDFSWSESKGLTQEPQLPPLPEWKDVRPVSATEQTAWSSGLKKGHGANEKVTLRTGTQNGNLRED